MPTQLMRSPRQMAFAVLLAVTLFSVAVTPARADLFKELYRGIKEVEAERQATAKPTPPPAVSNHPSMLVRGRLHVDRAKFDELAQSGLARHRPLAVLPAGLAAAVAAGRGGRLPPEGYYFFVHPRVYSVHTKNEPRSLSIHLPAALLPASHAEATSPAVTVSPRHEEHYRQVHVFEPGSFLS